MQKNKINIGKNNISKILLFIAILSLSGLTFGASNELENIIKDYYNNKEYDLMNMRKTDNKGGKSLNGKMKSRLSLNITQGELMTIANQIFKNETGGTVENLVDWNAGENFPSLGIGHFIWYKSSLGGPYAESFPQMVSFYRSQGIKLPRILEENTGSPWKSRSELLRKKKNGNRDIIELIDFFDRTRDTQILFIFERLEDSLDKMLNASANSENVRKQFYRVANSPNGMYALIDYVNFKGEGISDTNGWGLRQVLENMRGNETGKSALIEFSDSAKYVLEKRVNNSRQHERKWLPGWFKRVDTYKTFQVR